MKVQQKKDIKRVALLFLGSVSGGFLTAAVLSWLH